MSRAAPAGSAEKGVHGVACNVAATSSGRYRCRQCVLQRSHDGMDRSQNNHQPVKLNVRGRAPAIGERQETVWPIISTDKNVRSAAARGRCDDSPDRPRTMSEWRHHCNRRAITKRIACGQGLHFQVSQSPRIALVRIRVVAVKLDHRSGFRALEVSPVPWAGVVLALLRHRVPFDRVMLLAGTIHADRW